MRITSVTPVLFAFTVAGCIAADDAPTDQTEAAVHTVPSEIPLDGECTHIVATRLSDFATSEYRGVLAEASFPARVGEHHVTAVAYPQPCQSPPASAPWEAEPQVARFLPGDNELPLHFRGASGVGVVPDFDGDESLIVIEETRVRIGRNGEDAAGTDLSLDGWEVRQIAVPPAGGGGVATETTLFSLEGVGGVDALPYTPRGLAQLPDGRLVAQIGESAEPLRVYNANGSFAASWPVEYADGIEPWSWTDGLDAFDANLVRTIYDNATGRTGLEILELRADHVAVVQRIELVDAAYVVGVARVPGGFAVATLPEGGSQVTVIDEDDGAVLAGPTVLDGSAEGLFLTADGRLGALEYEGRLRMLDGVTVALRPGEELLYPIGAGISNPGSLTWDDSAGGYLALVGKRVVATSATFASPAAPVLDLSSYVQPSSLDYVPVANQIATIDRVPPQIAGGTRPPVVDLWDRVTLTQVGAVTLAGVSLPARPRTIAVLPSRGQIASHHRRPGAPVDATIDAVVWIHDLATGALIRQFDLAPFGFVRVAAVNYLRDTDELLLTVVDVAGTVRLLVTDPAGTPRRSFRADDLAGFTDLAPIPGGDVGVVIGQPSQFVQIALP
jgi:hypothetical protein